MFCFGLNTDESEELWELDNEGLKKDISDSAPSALTVSLLSFFSGSSDLAEQIKTIPNKLTDNPVINDRRNNISDNVFIKTPQVKRSLYL
ncbi:hypothetical protein H1P_3650002 [Hyella patelloides LEGE 07179]|uniref:Uncharacterized protein n=1 Tax=Hyella patelloides LEGE 07179 TaxID=945734 RepID=A0A563VWG6_9CYAN|nr:hypothetical protein H1P_3650002 [Hyella patelloides LEGE 07179]